MIRINSFDVIRVTKNIKKSDSNAMYPNLLPLKKDTISFRAKESETQNITFKKSNFQGIDLAVARKYKVDIHRLKSNQDLQEFAKNEINKLTQKDYKGRSKEAIVQRIEMLDEWFNYVIKENDAYTNTQRLIILSAITKNLKPNTDEIPEVLNKGILAQTITNLEEKLKLHPKENFDFLKMYKENLRNYFIEETNTGETMTGWIVIPSKEKDPTNFEKNVDRLKILSHKNWCTKSINAAPYLEKGDFHIYLENGQPKLGVRFIDDKIAEIEGVNNNSTIPVNYLNLFKDYYTENNFELGILAKNQVERAEKTLIEVEKIKKELGSAIHLKTEDDVLKLLNYFDMKCEKTEKGLVVKYFSKPKVSTFMEMGIDEDKLFKHIYKIEKYANFVFSTVTDLGKLEFIGGSADFTYSPIKTLGNLKYIGGDVTLNYSDITDLGALEHIGGSVEFSGSKLESLGNLESISGNANFFNSQVQDLGNLESIGGNASFFNSKVQNLGKLKTIGKDASFNNSTLTSLDSLKTIGRRANFFQSEVSDLGELTSIGNDAIFTLSKIKKLKNLEFIGGNAVFSNSKVEGVGKLKYIGGDVGLQGSKLRRRNFRNIEVRGYFGK